MQTKIQKDLEADIVIVGGGPAGCALTSILCKGGLKAICIDQDDPATSIAKTFDGRTTAISYGSRNVMMNASAWDALSDEACPIKDIKIMDGGSPTLLEFLVDDVDSPAFGWIVENRKLRAALYKQLTGLKNATHLAPMRVTDYSRDEKNIYVHLADGRKIQSQLVIGADGKKSFTRDWMGIETRGWNYGQRGVVCIVHHEHPHDNIAIEDFRSEGPFAVLPMNDDEQGNHRSSIVWTEHGPDKDSALHWDEETFNAALAERFPEFYGSVALDGKRFSYPLSLSHAHSYIAPRMALIGDAAHAIHPIAGQGLNLGLRDVAVLAGLLIAAKNEDADLGNMDLLQAYERARRLDNMSMAAATDTLNRLFSNGIAPVRILRKVGLRMVQKFSPARKFFMKQAMGIKAAL